MKAHRDLIVFIHGMGVKEPEEYLQKLMTGIRQYCHGKGVPIQTVEDSEGEAPGHRRLEVTVDGHPKTLEFQEVYWGDLRPTLSSESVMTKAIRGVNLLGFWLSSWKTVKQAFYSKYYDGQYALYHLAASHVVLRGVGDGIDCDWHESRSVWHGSVT